MLLYMFIIVFGVGVSIFIYFSMSERKASFEMIQLAEDAIESDIRSYDVVISDVNNLSKILIANQPLQNTLQHGYMSYETQLRKYLIEVAAFNKTVSSIYIFRDDSEKYQVEKKSFKNFTLDQMKDTGLYQELVDLNGSYTIKLNAGGLINEHNRDYLSFMRVIKSLNDQKIIGVMCINIELNYLATLIGKNAKAIVDSGKAYIAFDNSKANFTNEALVGFFSEGDKFFKNIDTNIGLVAVVGRHEPKTSLNIVRAFSFEEMSKPYQTSQAIISFIIIINGIFIFMGSVWLSNYISKPITSLINSMEGVYEGKFEEVKFSGTTDEIGSLTKMYNIMIREIKTHINNAIEEQKNIQKAELDLLMAQIKPHFLYNTLDSINSLAVMGKNKEVSDTIRALGDFYRMSLNKGKEMIPFEKELQTVVSYLYIQNLRYGDLFEVNYNIEPETSGVIVPKMILQPLVENSIYHGIRGKVSEGKIIINAFIKESERNTKELNIEVIDTGAGMSEEQIAQAKQSGIGLSATIKRVEMTYGENGQVQVISKVGAGTKIIIKIRTGELSDKDFDC